MKPAASPPADPVRPSPYPARSATAGLAWPPTTSLPVDRVEPAKRIGDRQQPAGQPFEVPPMAGGKTVVPNALARFSVTKRVVDGRRVQPGQRTEETVPRLRPSLRAAVGDRNDPAAVLGRQQHCVQPGRAGPATSARASSPRSHSQVFQPARSSN